MYIVCFLFPRADDIFKKVAEKRQAEYDIDTDAKKLKQDDKYVHFLVLFFEEITKGNLLKDLLCLQLFSKIFSTSIYPFNFERRNVFRW